MAQFDNGLMLHVGLPKTGTKTLQQTLFANHSQLHYLGKYVNASPFAKGCSSNDALQVLQPVLWKVNQPYNANETARLCRDQLLSKVPHGKCLIASWESLGSRSTDTYRKMLERICNTFGFCRIIFVLRNPYALIPSMYLQNVHGKFVRRGRLWMGPSCSITLEKWFDIKQGDQLDPSGMLNYSQNIQTSIEQLGKDNVGVFLFEDLANDPEGYYRSLSRYIGIDAEEALPLCRQKHLHRRITQRQYDIIMRLDATMPGRKLLSCSPASLRRVLLKTVGGNRPAKVSPTSEMRKSIAAKTKDGHRWLVNNLGLHLEKYGYPL